MSILEMNGLDVSLLTRLSCPSEFGVSLKRTLRHVTREQVTNELIRVSQWYDEQELLHDLAIDLRIKSLQSGLAKYDRYYPRRELCNTFNDLIGFRTLSDSYDEVLNLEKVQHFRIVDMSHGKKDDDGYRGVHVYFQLDNNHYPIEIQFNTYYDRQLNDWLHQFVYKKSYDNVVGRLLRSKYEAGLIRNFNEFEEVLSHVLSDWQTY